MLLVSLSFKDGCYMRLNYSFFSNLRRIADESIWIDDTMVPPVSLAWRASSALSHGMDTILLPPTKNVKQDRNQPNQENYQRDRQPHGRIWIPCRGLPCPIEQRIKCFVDFLVASVFAPFRKFLVRLSPRALTSETSLTRFHPDIRFFAKNRSLSTVVNNDFRSVTSVYCSFLCENEDWYHLSQG